MASLDGLVTSQRVSGMTFVEQNCVKASFALASLGLHETHYLGPSLLSDDHSLAICFVGCCSCPFA